MREVRVPMPTSAWELRCEGPFSPSAPNVKGALARLDNALSALPRLDIAQGEEGWTVVWRSTVLESGPLLKLWVWCARPERGAALLRALTTHLESAGFTVRTAPRPLRADAGLEPRVVYLRAGTVRLGLEPRTSDLLRDIEVVEEERDDINLGLRYRFGAQRCPSCRVEDVPLALVAGFPGPELLLAAELGEVAFADGGLVDRRSRNNARCRRCGADFVAR
jgi:hypothetical protein